MAEEIMVSATKPKKKSLFKRWWFWGLAIVIVIVIASVSSQSGSTVYELGKMTQMSKQQIIEKFGKPDEVVRDDKDGYNYVYNGGFTVSGTETGANNIVLSNELVKNKNSDAYKIFDVQLNSSFEENVKRLGKPKLNLKKDNKNLAVYLTKEGLLLSFSSKYNEDKVSAIELSSYDTSMLSSALEIGKLLGNKATEDDIKQNFTIKDKSTDAATTMYALDGFNLVVDNKSQTISQVFISSDSIYNIQGIRTTDSLDKATKLFGNPIQTKEGVKNTTQYTYNVDNAGVKNKIIVSADNTSKEIQYIELSLK
jgi:hypothetical protein